MDQKSKAVFVDGASFFHILRNLGISQINADKFFTVLQEEIGLTSNLFGKPVYVLQKQLERFPEKPYSSAGFEIRKPTSEEKSADDEEIRRAINAVNSEQISELVLVTADVHDYLDCLRAKSAQGVKIYIVATKQPDQRNGRSMLSSSFDELIKENGFDFVEFLSFKDRLMTKAWEEKPRPESQSRRSFGVSIELIEDPVTLARLAKDLADLMSKYPNIKISTAYKGLS